MIAAGVRSGRKPARNHCPAHKNDGEDNARQSGPQDPTLVTELDGLVAMRGPARGCASARRAG
jgi:hypothetical protein